MTPLRLRQLQALLRLKLLLLQRFWNQRDKVYKWSLLISTLFTTALSLLLGSGVGWLVFLLAPSDGSDLFGAELLQDLWLTVFLLISLIWLLSPLLFIMKNESLALDVSRLTRYPISYRTLHGFHTLLALLDPWTLFYYPIALGVLAAMGVRGGPGLLAPVGLLLGLWILAHTAWSRLLQDLITMLFTSRRLREVLSLGVILTVILVSFVPAVLSEQLSLEQLSSVRAPSLELYLFQWPLWRQLYGVLSLLLYATPAGGLVHGLAGLLYHQRSWWLQGCAMLAGWTGLAWLLGVNLLRRLFTEPARLAQKTHAGLQLRSRWRLPGLPYDLRVLVLKELRTYFRSILGKLSFFLTPMLTVVLRLIGLGASSHAAPASLLLGMIVYVFMTSLFLYINYFGADGEGFKLYLLSGLPARRLILAKNLALGLFSAAEFAVVLILFALLYRQLDTDTLVFGIGAFGYMLMGVLSLGNLLSLRFASAMDLNQTQYRQSNGTPILLALQALSLLAGIASLALWQAGSRHEPLWLVGLTLAGLMTLAWHLLLPFCTQLLVNRGWDILEQITQQE